MLAVTTGNAVADTVIGVFVLVALIVVWRVLLRDPSIRRVRLGVFYERERDGDDEDEDVERRVE